jgi:hypothetical protein
VDASNILRFEGVGDMSPDVMYAVEWWIFKPQKTGQQVIYLYILFHKIDMIQLCLE